MDGNLEVLNTCTCTAMLYSKRDLLQFKGYKVTSCLSSTTTMNRLVFIALAFAFLANAAAGFSGPQPILDRVLVHQTRLFLHEDDRSRRSLLVSASVASLAAFGALSRPDDALAAVGTLPELQDANAVLQGLTIKVTDPSQQKQMISFLQDAFEMEVLRGTPDGLDTVSHCTE